MKRKCLVDLTQYELLTKIGFGAFSNVYKIKEKKNGKIYTAKVSKEFFDKKYTNEWIKRWNLFFNISFIKSIIYIFRRKQTLGLILSYNVISLLNDKDAYL